MQLRQTQSCVVYNGLKSIILPLSLKTKILEVFLPHPAGNVIFNCFRKKLSVTHSNCIKKWTTCVCLGFMSHCEQHRLKAICTMPTLFCLFEITHLLPCLETAFVFSNMENQNKFPKNIPNSSMCYSYMFPGIVSCVSMMVWIFLTQNGMALLEQMWPLLGEVCLFGHRL